MEQPHTAAEIVALVVAATGRDHEGVGEDVGRVLAELAAADVIGAR